MGLLYLSSPIINLQVKVGRKFARGRDGRQYQQNSKLLTQVRFITYCDCIQKTCASSNQTKSKHREGKVVM